MTFTFCCSSPNCELVSPLSPLSSLKQDLNRKQLFFHAALVIDPDLGKISNNSTKDNEELSMRKITKTKKMSQKCNQCNFASSWASSLRDHLKTHSGEKPNKCNQCNYASIQAVGLRRHMQNEHDLEQLSK